MYKFSDYISFPENKNIHPEMKFNYPKFNDFVHLIVYGPCGIGKYTQVLKIIHHYSTNHLKIEKKMLIEPTFIKFSDIHYEIDMNLLGCNSKLLWNDMYQQIVDIIQSKTEKRGFIVCKNFHTINKDYIFTLNVCATQELHRRIEAQDKRIKELETKLEKLINYIYQ
jgi:hypothetical protein